jgi:hypothetical protein
VQSRQAVLNRLQQIGIKITQEANKMSIELRIPYYYDTDAVSKKNSITCEDESLTVQSQKDESDINNIIRRFGLTGEMPTNPVMPQYGDFTGIKDYQSALNQIIKAKEDFMTLPPEIRKRFNHDPQILLDFISDPQNQEEAVKLGLLKAVKKPADGGAAVPASTPPATQTTPASPATTVVAK